jgi:hypothetical protein
MNEHVLKKLPTSCMQNGVSEVNNLHISASHCYGCKAKHTVKKSKSLQNFGYGNITHTCLK